MSVNYNTSVLTSRLQQVINAIDAGPSNGFMRLLDSANNVLSSLQLARPSGIAANAVLSFSGLALVDPSAAAGGAVTAARCETSDGTVVISGLTVGTSSASDIFMTPTNVVIAGQTVAITAATITGN